MRCADRVWERETAPRLARRSDLLDEASARAAHTGVDTSRANRRRLLGPFLLPKKASRQLRRHSGSAAGSRGGFLLWNPKRRPSGSPGEALLPQNPPGSRRRLSTGRVAKAVPLLRMAPEESILERGPCSLVQHWSPQRGGPWKKSGPIHSADT